MYRKDYVYRLIEVVNPTKTFLKPTRFMISGTRNNLYDSLNVIRLHTQFSIFHYTLSGTGEFKIDGNVHKVGAGQGFLCPSACYDISYNFPMDGVEEWKFLCLCFEGENVHNITRDIIKNYGPVFTTSINSNVIKKMLSFEFEQESIEMSCSDATKLLYYLFFELMNREKDDVSNTYHPLVRETKKIIKNSLKSNLNVSQIAQMLNTSRENLSRIFSKNTGMKLNDYIKNERIIYSVKLLRETSKTISEIADILDYSSASNFSRDFISIMEVTPKQFRDAQNIELL